MLAPFLLAEQEGATAAKSWTSGSSWFRAASTSARLWRAAKAISAAPAAIRRSCCARRICRSRASRCWWHSFLTLVTRHDSFETSGSFEGKAIDVPSLKDTSYYAVQKMAEGSSGSSLRISTQARPPAELIAALGSRRIDGFIGTVDWGVKAEREGVRLDYRELDAIYPAMAQAIMASETTIAAKPKVLRRFVRATLQVIRQIARDPEGQRCAMKLQSPPAVIAMPRSCVFSGCSPHMSTVI
ncbi:ABC transporter substrate-binding protein [Novosphingobium resinovorum]